MTKLIAYLSLLWMPGLQLMPTRHFFADSLHIVSAGAYHQQVKAQPNLRLVDLQQFVPGLKFDIRYATTNNFMHARMYQQARAFARYEVAMALRQAVADFAKRGLGIKIFDAYRPYAVTVKFYQQASDKHYVADPAKGSRHNRGCAIDLTLFDLKTGQNLPMPTDFDSFSPKAWPHYPNLPQNVKQNRQLLINVMQAHGFTVMKNEWWHFDFNGWPAYNLLDIPIEEL